LSAKRRLNVTPAISAFIPPLQYVQTSDLHQPVKLVFALDYFPFFVKNQWHGQARQSTQMPQRLAKNFLGAIIG
jgi:hypothetical protein